MLTVPVSHWTENTLYLVVMTSPYVSGMNKRGILFWDLSKCTPVQSIVSLSLLIAAALLRVPVTRPLWYGIPSRGKWLQGLLKGTPHTLSVFPQGQTSHLLT